MGHHESCRTDITIVFILTSASSTCITSTCRESSSGETTLAGCNIVSTTFYSKRSKSGRKNAMFAGSTGGRYSASETELTPLERGGKLQGVRFRSFLPTSAEKEEAMDFDR
jgi:hypothetical protein